MHFFVQKKEVKMIMLRSRLRSIVSLLLFISIIFLFHPLPSCASIDEYNRAINEQVCENSENNPINCSSNNEILAQVDADGNIIQIRNDETENNDMEKKEEEEHNNNSNNEEAEECAETNAEDYDYNYYGEDYDYASTYNEEEEDELPRTLLLNTWGKPQVAKGSDAEVDLIKAKDKEMNDYMNNEVFVKEEFEQIRPYCRNHNTLCLLWTSVGECESNRDFMVENCSPACSSCNELSKIFDYETAHVDDDEKIVLNAPKVKVEKGEMVAIPWGVPQNLGIMFPDKVQTVLDETTKYMRDTVYVDKQYAKMYDACENRVEDCSHWAALGECEKNPKYMKFYCAPACNSCEYLDYHIRCPVDPEAFVAWSKPGDLNKFFERIVNDPYWEENHGPVSVISSPATGGPWVITIDNFISKEEAARLIEFGYEVGFERSGDVGEPGIDGKDEGVVSDWRTSKNAWCPDECRTDPIVGPAHDRVERLTGIPYVHWEWWQLLWYETGQYYNFHNDYVYYEVTRPQGPRILTGFFYLNDVKAGGGTRFTELNVTVMPKIGRAVFWPSVLDEAPMEMDERTNHEALVVEAGVKYGANVWVHQRDVKTPMANECG